MNKIAASLLFFILTSIWWPAPPAFANEESTFDAIVRIKSDPNWPALQDKYSLLAHRRLFESSPSAATAGLYRLTVSSQINPASVLGAMRASNDFWWVEKESTVSAAVDANDEFYTRDASDTARQWHLPKIEASRAWDINKESPQMTVAIVDTGIFAAHQDLKDGRVAAGYKVFCEEISGETCLRRTRGDISANASSDDNGHGTSVASVVSAASNNLAGIAGVTWSAKLMPVKVLNKDGVGTASDVAEGIVWAAQHGANIINLSLGGAAMSDSEVLNVATDIARQSGVMVVAAAGNDRTNGLDLDTFPTGPVCSDGQNNNVLGVAATDFEDKKTIFSNYGAKCIDISAPGLRILSAYFDPNQPDLQNVYVYRSGTSFAAPQVSAAAALVRTILPNLTIAEVQDRLKNAADKIEAVNSAACDGLPCGSQLGAGRLNLYNALSGIKAPEPVVPPPATPPPPAPVANEGDVVKVQGGAELYIIDQSRKRLLIPFVASQRNINTASPKELSAAQFNNLLAGPPLPPLDDTLVRGQNSLAVFVIKNGLRRPLSYLSFVSHGFKFADVVVLEDAFVSGLPEGGLYHPKQGALARANNELVVYYIDHYNSFGQLLENPLRRPIPYISFVSYGFNFSSVIVVDKAQIELVPAGGDLLPRNGSLVRASNSLTVYLVQGMVGDTVGYLHPVTYQAFIDRGYKFSDVSVVPPSEVARYPVGSVIKD